MTASATRPEVRRADIHEAIIVEPGQLAKLQSDLEAAERAEADANRAHLDAVGRVILDEASVGDVAKASKTLGDAGARTTALRSALAILRERQEAQNAQDARDRLRMLREQSDSSHAASLAAMARLSTLAKEMQEALSDADAESAIVETIHRDLMAAAPAQAAEIDQDYLQAQTRASDTHRSAVGEVRSVAAGARNSISRLPAAAQVGIGLALDNETAVPVGTPVEDASAIIAAWELRSVEQADHDRVTALRHAYQRYVSDMHDAGLGWLLMPDRVIREALGDVALRLIPDQVRLALSGLAEFLPASSTSGVSVRTIFRDPFEARMQARRFEAGIAAFRMLTQ